ncbi:MAG: ethanolamine utilization protein EutN [Calditrichaeota bacterium]|nr:MAG: ethanolamine utilization protein EutN [Calditrichota bacterium]MBL1207848.1 ethanolamine utilization protein EutN [Calditrichota bacterium]NOG47682.1 EutN/CcmL family microcompartment protein [Calditrichota bacterium]
MDLAKVVGKIWATQKDTQLEGLKMQLIQPVDANKKNTGSLLIAVDTVGAGEGDLVFYITASEAVIPLEKKPALTDASIIGIVDRINI